MKNKTKSSKLKKGDAVRFITKGDSTIPYGVLGEVVTVDGFEVEILFVGKETTTICAPEELKKL